MQATHTNISNEMISYLVHRATICFRCFAGWQYVLTSAVHNFYAWYDQVMVRYYAHDTTADIAACEIACKTNNNFAIHSSTNMAQTVDKEKDSWVKVEEEYIANLGHFDHTMLNEKKYMLEHCMRMLLRTYNHY